MKEEEIKKIVLALGADVCGIAQIKEFGDAREGFSPTDIFSECKSVISFGVAIPKGCFEVNPRLIYNRCNDVAKDKVDYIAFEAAKAIEKRFSCTAVPLPSDSPYDYWDAQKKEGRGIISMKHAAQAAGLGCLGKSSIFLNREYGNRLNLGAILLDTELKGDEKAKSICIEGCRKCIESCPAGAINEDGTVTQKLCRENAYNKNARGFNIVDCNKCRAGCPMKYGI